MTSDLLIMATSMFKRNLAKLSAGAAPCPPRQPPNENLARLPGDAAPNCATHHHLDRLLPILRKNHLRPILIHTRTIHPPSQSLHLCLGDTVFLVQLAGGFTLGQGLETVEEG
jgi:hypothetical protein